jgi:hypothetical protein
VGNKRQYGFPPVQCGRRVCSLRAACTTSLQMITPFHRYGRRTYSLARPRNRRQH